MNCSKSKASIQDFIDNNLDENTEHSIRSHLDSCPECTVEHKKYTSLIALLHDSPVPLPSDAEWNDIHSSILENLPEQQTVKTNGSLHRIPFQLFKTPVFRIAAAVVLSAVSFASVLTYLNLQSDVLYPKVVAVNGNGLTVDAADIPAGTDYTLTPGNAIETDENSSLKIQVDKKSTIQIGNASRCKIAAVARKRRVFELQKGDLRSVREPSVAQTQPDAEGPRGRTHQSRPRRGRHGRRRRHHDQHDHGGADHGGAEERPDDVHPELGQITADRQ